MATIPANRLAEHLTQRAETIGDQIIDDLAAEAVRGFRTDAPRDTGALAASVRSKRGLKRGTVLITFASHGFILDRWKRSPLQGWMRRTRDRVNAELVRIAGRRGNP